MRTMNGLPLLCMMALFGVRPVTGQGADFLAQFYTKQYVVPTDAQIAQARAEFLALREPLEYECVVDEPPSGPWSGDPGVSHVALQGDMRELAERHGLAVLVYALWSYLDDPEYDARAFLVLESMVDALNNGFPLGYKSRAEPGDWPARKKLFLTGYKWYCAMAIGERGKGWYPHRVLFDSGVVYAERKDPVKRAEHVEALRAALRDPALRAGNPLGVEDVFALLLPLEAKEAAPEVADYLFYSWRQGGPYRASAERLRVPPEGLADKVVISIGSECPAHDFLARDVGKSSVPLFLEKYSHTSEEDRLVADGGGCAPLFALQYFVLLGFTRADAVAAIDDYLQTAQGLTAEQTAVLVSLRQIVQSGQYQAQRLLFDNVPGGWDPVPAP